MTDDIRGTLRALRGRVGELEAAGARAAADVRFAVLGTSLAVGLLVLTATLWAVDGDGDNDGLFTLWGLAALGWQGFAMLTLVFAVALGTVWAFAVEPPIRGAHLVLMWLSLFAGVGALVVGAVVPEGHDSAPGRWLTLLACLAVAGCHGFRAEQLGPSRR